MARFHVPPLRAYPDRCAGRSRPCSGARVGVFLWLCRDFHPREPGEFILRQTGAFQPAVSRKACSILGYA
eukprot:2211737-Heterocapsa_arctica.AAC.1